MNNNIYYAIRHRPSGRFLPAVNSYGFTRVEPSAVDPPRLFKVKSAATQALNWWLEGEAYEDVVERLDSSGPEREIRIKVFKRLNRHASEMEIVVISLSVKSLQQAELDRL